MNNPLSLAKLSPPVRWLVNRISKLDILRDWYDEWLANHDGSDAKAFLDYTLNKTGIRVETVNADAIAQTQEGERLIVVANHPLGGLEGMLLSQLLLQYRSDVKVLTNEMLLSFKEFHSLFIGVDVLNPNKQLQNAKGIRQVSKHLKEGGALLVFPSGTVSHMRLNDGAIIDPEWQDIVGRLALKYQAKCLPIHVDGRNSRSFYLSGYIHSRLRTMMLPRAMISKKNHTVTLRVGEPSVLDKESLNARSATDYLRMGCELLGPSGKADAQAANIGSLLEKQSPVNAVIEYLPQLQEFCVLNRGNFDVYCAPFDKLGPMADLLAIEREKTFRAVGEGTGLDRDIDQFDPYYWHIWVWDKQNSNLVGSYRAANIQTLVKSKGVSSLYSNSLFHYDQRFLASLGGAIEVGRSFVAARYQSSSQALDLLWHGLGHFMLQNPDCHTLFGCVSISKSYAPIVRALLVDALLAGHAAEEGTRALVKPHTPFTFKQRFWSKDLAESLVNMTAINKLLGRGNYQYRVPALIRHYIALRGKFIDFSINRGFNDSLDGLIFVDLRQTPDRYVKRYMGEQGAEQFRQSWGQQDAA